MKKLLLPGALILSLLVAFSNCKKKTSTPEEDPQVSINLSNAKYALVIDNGPQSVEVGKNLSLSAHLVSSTGAIVSPGTVTWSSNVGGISGTGFSLNTPTVGIISASVQYEGKTYTSAIPISIQPEKSTQLFAVIPSAIIWSANAGSIQLNTVYLGGSATYNFTSDNSSIASVSNTGDVTCKAVGNTVIRVKATINGQVSEIDVPVMVAGEPDVPLPVTRIVVNPPLGELFRGETLQLNAKAYNSKGEDVTSTVTFNYVVVPKQEGDEPNPVIAASVNGSGMVSALTIGDAYVKVSANGITGQAEIIVNPDTVLTVTPFIAYLGMDYSQFPPVQNPDNATFTATTQKVDRVKYKNHDPGFLSTIPNPANLQWALPETGIPEIDNVFKVVTLSNATTSSVKATAIQGKTGSTFVIAYAGSIGGGASIMVNP